MKITATECQYRRTMSYIGLTMIFFLVFFVVGNVLSGIVGDFMYINLPYDYAYVFEELLNSVIYLISFMVPVAFYFAISKNKTEIVSMKADLTLPRETPLMIVAGIGTVYIFAYLNMFATSFLPNVTEEPSEMTLTLPMVIMLFISIGLVPAFCEEFLFRGLILRNLLPYSGKIAIIISAVMFGLMHQNIYQIIYTTVAGIVMGYIYYKTDSLWCTVLMHFFNNSVSVVELVIYGNVENAEFVNLMIDISLMVAGVLCFTVLTVRYVKNKRREIKRAEEGIVGTSFAPRLGYAERRLSSREAVRSFFTPSVIVFTSIIALTYILQILIAYLQLI